jgi:hypothetical protein
MPDADIRVIVMIQVGLAEIKDNPNLNTQNCHSEY